MKRIICTLLVIAVCLSLAACSLPSQKIELSGEFYILQIPVSDTELLEVQIPEECSIIETDNIDYWKMLNDMIVIVHSKQVKTATQNEETGLYVQGGYITREVGDTDVCISVPRGMQKTLKAYLSSADTVIASTTLDTATAIEYPDHEDKSSVMKLYDETSLYMPVNLDEVNTDATDLTQTLQISGCTAELLTYDSNYLMCWIQDGKFDDIKDRLMTDCIANSPKNSIESWCLLDDRFYATSGENILAMKKLTANSWCVYLGTNNFKDYILTALDKVHRAE